MDASSLAQNRSTVSRDSCGSTRANVGWPDDRHPGWVLLAILVVAVIPIFFLLLDALVSSGGTLEAPGG